MNLTPRAKIRWEEIPAGQRLKILNSVWCVSCGKVTGIGEASGKIEKGRLVLQGMCTQCGKAVARVIE